VGCALRGDDPAGLADRKVVLWVELEVIDCRDLRVILQVKHLLMETRGARKERRRRGGFRVQG
jgi:hypothetical protein